MERCPVHHAGMNVRCGLPKGHRGNHTTEIPDEMPWAETKDLEQWFRELEDDNWGDAVEAIRAAFSTLQRKVMRDMSKDTERIDRIWRWIHNNIPDEPSTDGDVADVVIGLLAYAAAAKVKPVRRPGVVTSDD